MLYPEKYKDFAGAFICSEFPTKYSFDIKFDLI